MNPSRKVYRQLMFSLILVSIAVCTVSTSAAIPDLPIRETPRPETTDSIPHIQIDVEAVPEFSAELLRRVSKLAGVELRRTIVGRSGSTGFWLQEDQELVRHEAIIRGREFAHLHPDGSLHASLSADLADRAVEAGWATPHPWALKKRGLEGFVMIYTPISKGELDVVFQLVLESYRFVTGVERVSTDR